MGDNLLDNLFREGLEISSFYKRVLAFLIDYILVMAVMIVLIIALHGSLEQIVNINANINTIQAELDNLEKMQKDGVKNSSNLEDAKALSQASKIESNRAEPNKESSTKEDNKIEDNKIESNQKENNQIEPNKDININADSKDKSIDKNIESSTSNIADSKALSQNSINQKDTSKEAIDKEDISKQIEYKNAMLISSYSSMFYIALYAFIFDFLYQFVFTFMYGASLGKIALKIKIVDMYSFSKPDLKSSILRSLTRTLIVHTFMLILILAYFDRFKSAIHDKLSKTIVINN